MSTPNNDQIREGPIEADHTLRKPICGDPACVCSYHAPPPEAADLSSWTKSPHRLAVDAKGYVWRYYPDDDRWSMAPVNPDSSPIPEPVTYYVPGDEVERLETEMALALVAVTRYAEGKDTAVPLSKVIERLGANPE